MRRDNTNTAEGVATLQLGYVDVSELNCESATLVGQALHNAGAGRGCCADADALPRSVLIGSSHFCPMAAKAERLMLREP